ncbi:MAG: hypothetical protein OXJ90_19360 [Spirochaetaceae bacterium]|nr:hypothetical protein [Spirochaetaceae bacterium]MDE0362353.1 hypothetical protein [Rhodospirillaceae bacterium]
MSYVAPELITGGLSLILKGKSGRGKTHLAIAYRIVERGRLMLLDGPSYRTQPPDLDVDGAELAHGEPAGISGKHRPGFPEPTDHIPRVMVGKRTRRR